MLDQQKLVNQTIYAESILIAYVIEVAQYNQIC